MSSFIKVVIIGLIGMVMVPPIVNGQGVAMVIYVKDGQLKPVASASIIVEDSENILSYGYTDEKGFLAMKLAEKPKDSLLITVTSVGFIKKQLSVKQLHNPIDIVLEESVEMLPNVVITAKPRIEVANDTLRYYTSDFRSEKDRSIGEVIDKMPGMSVMEDGSIYFNGKLVKNIIIDGEDVTQGAYGILSKAVHHKYIKEVEVIKNYQGIKLLQGKYKSDVIVLNLKLANPDKLIISGELNAGVGLPDVVDANIKSVIFNQIVKAVNVLNYNNVGYNLASNYVFENKSDDYRPFEFNPRDIVSFESPSNPLPSNQSNINQSTSASLDNFFRIDKVNTINLNLRGNYDKTRFSYANQREFKVSDNVLQAYNESQEIHDKTGVLNGSLRYRNNSSKLYLSNNLSVALGKVNSHSDFMENQTLIPQSLQQFNNRVVNKFQIFPKLQGDQYLAFLVGLKAESYDSGLGVGEGIFKEQLNQGRSYDSLYQSASPKNRMGSFSARYSISRNPFHQSYSISYDKQNLTFPSGITTFNGELATSYLDEEVNYTTWNSDKVTFTPDYTYQIPGFTVSVTAPVSFLNIDFFDNQLNRHRDLKKVYLTGNADFNKTVFAEDRIYIDIFRKFDISNPYSFRETDFLHSYRYLSSGENQFYYAFNNTVSLNYRLERSIQFFFANFHASYSLLTANSMVNSTLEGSGIVTSFKNLRRNQSSYNAGISMDKYFYEGSFRLKADFNFGYLPDKILLNEELHKTKMLIYSPGFTLDKQFNRIIQVKYQASLHLINYGVIDNRLEVNSSQNTISLKHSISSKLIWKDLSVYGTINSFMMTSSNEKTKFNTYLWDVGAAYQVGRFDLKLECYNLLNMKYINFMEYKDGYSDFTRFNLRGRYFVVKGIFYFSL